MRAAVVRRGIRSAAQALRGLGLERRDRAPAGGHVAPVPLPPPSASPPALLRPENPYAGDWGTCGHLERQDRPRELTGTFLQRSSGLLSRRLASRDSRRTRF